MLANQQKMWDVNRPNHGKVSLNSADENFKCSSNSTMRTKKTYKSINTFFFKSIRAQNAFKIGEESTMCIKHFKSQLQPQWSDKTRTKTKASITLPVVSSPKLHFQHERQEKERWRRFWTPRSRRGLRSPIRRAITPRSFLFWGTQHQRSWRPQTDRLYTPTPISDRRRAKLREGVEKPRPHSPLETPACRRRPSFSGEHVTKFVLR